MKIFALNGAKTLLSKISPKNFIPMNDDSLMNIAFIDTFLAKIGPLINQQSFLESEFSLFRRKRALKMDFYCYFRGIVSFLNEVIFKGIHFFVFNVSKTSCFP